MILTNILVIYSAMTIFLVPIVLTAFAPEEKPWWLKACFLLFTVPFTISIFNTVRLIIPVKMELLNEPKVFYSDYRKKYEEKVNNRMSLEVLLKVSYVRELEDSLGSNIIIYQRKTKFYRNALIYVLISIIPYLICLGYHISKQGNRLAQITELVRIRKT